MPPLFPFNPSMVPIVPTRKALLILDLQNDFVSPDGALYTEEPEGYVDRILDLAKAFRDSGAGDVVWVRSEFERHCSLMQDGDQIITADTMVRPKKAAPSRGRQPTSTVHESAAMEDDDEAFLSIGKKDKKPCVRKGTQGAEFPPQVKAVIVPSRDIVFTKTHYSAFASGQQQLVQLLRGRFVTQMYICGALTNISIYATALGAGQHGYDVTLVEDCCGFRNTMRHLNAVRQLSHLTGCDAVSAEGLLEELQPPAPQTQSTGLSPSISKISLELGGGPRDAPAAGPRPGTPDSASPQPERSERQRTTPPRRETSSRSAPKEDKKRPANDTAPLEAHSDPSSSESESKHSQEENEEESERKRPPTAKKGVLESSEGPIPQPHGAGSAEAEIPRIVNRVRQRRAESPTSDEKPPTPPSSQTIPTRPELSADTTSESKGPVKDTPPSPITESKSSPTMADQHPAAVCSEPLCEGDTTVITNVLPPALAADAFERLFEEVSWAGMSHMGGEVPRRIAVQGEVAKDGSMPVYRHPADESPPLLPFSPTVLQIKAEVEKHLGHPLNHVLIQHYRTGNDYISEHSDKTLDIVPGSFIANVSLGAERTMIFRTKRPPRDKPTTSSTAGNEPSIPPHPDDSKDKDADPRRQTHRAPLPHNSLLRMGLHTNARWLHAIRQDKRADRDKTAPELAYGGARISLTFRQIGTFIDASQSRIWGQGATSKSKEGAREVVNGQTDEAVRLLRAFGAENNRGFGDGAEWGEWYGGGFDVLHMGVPKRVFYSSSPSSGVDVSNVSVALALAEMGVGCAKGSVEGMEVRFEDNDPGGTVVEGYGTVLRYLDAVYGVGRRYDQMLPGEVARRFVRLQRGLDLAGRWRDVVEEVGMKVKEGERASEEQVEAVKKLLKKELADWESWAEEASTAATSGDKSTSTETTGGAVYIAGGSQASPADFALWPLLHGMVRVCGEELLGKSLRRYYAAFRERSSVAKALGQVRAE